MLHRIAVSPQGFTGLVSSASEVYSTQKTSDIPADLVSAFRESFSHGLVELASSVWQLSVASWAPEYSFWRQFARHYFAAACRQYSSSVKQWVPVAPPDATLLADWISQSPPMLGLEYLKPPHLQNLWSEIDAHTQTVSRKHKDGLAGFLKSLDPNWNLIGRVTFHLAENKKNADAPFAFMATFTQGQSKEGAPQHLPLAEALKESIFLKDTEKLDQLLAPVSRAAESVPLVARLLESKKLFAPQAWGINQAYEFLNALPTMEQAGLVVRVPNWWNASRPSRPQVSVQVGSKEPSRFGLDGLDLDVNVVVEGEPLSDAELTQLLSQREGLMLLRGKWVEVDQSKLKSVLQHWNALRQERIGGVDFLQAMRMLSGAAIGEAREDSEVNQWVRMEPGDWMRNTLQQLRDPSGIGAVDPSQVVNATLRHYQLDGVRWLWFATQLGLGVCLADDMGLGKTLQIISLIALMKKHGSERLEKSPVLIVVPTSLLGNWQRELAKFAPQLKLFVAHLSTSSKEEIKAIEADPANKLADVDVVMVTYGAIRNAKWLTEVTWKMVILDEAQAIKNSGSQQSKAIKAIPTRRRIIMTGTPIENNLGDLWSLFDFCAPGLLGNVKEFKSFVSSKDDHQRSQRLSALRKLVQPYVLRRMKTDPDIVPDLPAKTEMRVDCSLSSVQVALYREVVEGLESALKKAEGIQRHGLVLAALMQLKQICNHPALFLKTNHFKAAESGKYGEIQRLCEDIRENQEKVLVFTQFQSMCEPLSQFLGEVFGREGLVITGKTSAKARSQLVNEFQEPFGPPFFVISVKAGGTGLNLTEACHVVHFDRWWNPAVEDQATDRAFRIGQKRNVMVHKFVTAGTLEERIDDLIYSKRKLSREIFDSSGEINLTELSNDELLNFIALDINKANQS